MAVAGRGTGVKCTFGVQRYVQTQGCKALLGQVLWGQKDCGDVTEQQAVMSLYEAL